MGILVRDGVSESQFNQVLNIEVDQIIKVVFSKFLGRFSLLSHYVCSESIIMNSLLIDNNAGVSTSW